MYTPHSLYEGMPAETVIWRYISLQKFADLIRTSSLYFCRVDILREQDRREGTLTVKEREFIEHKFFGNDLYKFLRRNRVSSIGKVQVEGRNRFDVIREMRVRANLVYRYYLTRTYVCCWHINSEENNLMWGSYLRGEPGVAVRTTVGNLIDALVESERKTYILPIKYINHHLNHQGDSNLPSKIFNGGLYTVMEDMLMKKALPFKAENELRAFTADLVDQEKFNDNLLGDHLNLERLNEVMGIHVPASLEKLLQNIVTCPGISEENLKVVMDVLDMTPTLRDRIVRSQLE